ISERLFGAVNVSYEPELRITSPGNVGERESGLEVSVAGSARIVDNMFFGAEARYLTRHQGYFFNEGLGRAFYFGPTLYLSLGESGYLGAAWSVQLAGSATDEPGSRLDLVNFERHQFRVKTGFSF